MGTEPGSPSARRAARRGSSPKFLLRTLRVCEAPALLGFSPVARVVTMAGLANKALFNRASIGQRVLAASHRVQAVAGSPLLRRCPRAGSVWDAWDGSWVSLPILEVPCRWGGVSHPWAARAAWDPWHLWGFVPALPGQRCPAGAHGGWAQGRAWGRGHGAAPGRAPWGCSPGPPPVPVPPGGGGTRLPAGLPLAAGAVSGAE